MIFSLVAAILVMYKNEFRVLDGFSVLKLSKRRATFMKQIHETCLPVRFYLRLHIGIRNVAIVAFLLFVGQSVTVDYHRMIFLTSCVGAFYFFEFIKLSGTDIQECYTACNN